MSNLVVDSLFAHLMGLMNRYVSLERICSTWENSLQFQLDRKLVERQCAIAMHGFDVVAVQMVEEFNQAQRADERMSQLRSQYILAVSPAVLLCHALRAGLDSSASAPQLECFRARFRAPDASFHELLGDIASDGAVSTLRILAPLEPMLATPPPSTDEFGPRRPLADVLAALEPVFEWLAQMKMRDPEFGRKNKEVADLMAADRVVKAMRQMPLSDWLEVARTYYERAGGRLH